MTRIASFLASATEIVCAIGVAEQLVGISHECDYPPSILALPRLSKVRFDVEGLTSGEIDAALRRAMAEHGSAYAIDEAALVAVRPDVILTQAVCDVCAVPTPGVKAAVRRLGLGANIHSVDAHSLTDMLGTIRQVALAAGANDGGERLIDHLRQRLGAVAASINGVRPVSVVALEWLEPPFAPGHWVPEMIRLAGGQLALGTPGGTSVEVSWAELEGFDPDVLLVMPCGYDLARSARDAARSAALLARIAPRAVASGRAYALDGSAYFSRSGPRLVRGVEILAGLLHPDRWPEPTELEALALPPM